MGWDQFLPTAWTGQADRCNKSAMNMAAAAKAFHEEVNIHVDMPVWCVKIYSDYECAAMASSLDTAASTDLFAEKKCLNYSPHPP